MNRTIMIGAGGLLAAVACVALAGPLDRPQARWRRRTARWTRWTGGSR
jgi:hypothetical protein